MRHANKLKKLGRVSEHRKALMKNLAKSLIKHERIVTTTAKAKALRPYIEKIVTKAVKATKAIKEEKDATHYMRLIFAKLQDKKAIKKLIEDFGERYQGRAGGYTRIYKMYNRRGDAAEMSMIEFVEESLEETVATEKTQKED